MTIITGGRGTGKSFVGQALASSDPDSELHEVRNTDEAVVACRTAKAHGKKPILVCDSSLMINAAEIASRGGWPAAPAFAIHITRSTL